MAEGPAGAGAHESHCHDPSRPLLTHPFTVKALGKVQQCRIIEYPMIEGTHKDPRVQNKAWRDTHPEARHWANRATRETMTGNSM